MNKIDRIIYLFILLDERYSSLCVIESISWELLEILVDFDWNQKWFTKRIKISWYEEEFNPKKFKKIE